MVVSQGIPTDPMRRRSTGWIVCALVGALVLLSRARSIATGFELNLDESHLAAQALRYGVDPIPWRSVDGETSGPISAWLLAGLHWVGVPLHYPILHALAALLLTGSVVLLFWAARAMAGPRSAALAALAAAVWLACDVDPDFVHYSTEVVPVALLCAALTAGWALGRPTLAAVLLGIVPWTKLQAAPIAFVLGLWLVGRALAPISQSAGAGRNWTAAVRLAGVASLPSAALLALIAGGGALQGFWISYFEINRYYAGAFGPAIFGERLGRLLIMKPLSPWLTPVLLSALLALGLRRKSWSLSALRGTPGLIAAMTLVSLYVSIRPGNDFDHYELLLIPALGLLTAATAHGLGLDRPPTGRRPFLLAWTIVIPLVCATYLGDAVRRARRGYPLPEDGLIAKVLAEVQRLAPGPHTYAYWGWGPSIYVLTNTVPPTRHSHAYLMTAKSPDREFMRANFMEDLVRNPTDIFLDLYPTGMGMTPLSDFPQLDAYVSAHFRRIGGFDTIRGPVVIYARTPPE